MSSKLDNFILWLQRHKRPIDRLWTIGFFLFAVVLLTWDLGSLPLRDWDEGLVAQVAKEIYQAPFNSLTWLHPTMWGEPYFNKPPLVHWLIALCYGIGGVNEWTARLPGALLTAISVPLFYLLGREVFHRRSPAVCATLVYLTSLPVVRLGRLAMLDGAILCFLIGMMLCLLRSRRNYSYTLGAGIGLGLICLTKGIMLGLLLGAIGLGFLAWDTPRLLRSGYLWWGLLLGMIPALLWYGLQAVHYGDLFISNNLGSQSFQRIVTDVEQNRGAPWYYLLEILKYGAPWILFLPLGYWTAWEERNLGWAKLTIVWGGVYLAAISLMATKLPWYVLPLYPAMALAIGAVLSDLWKQGKHPGVLQSEPIPYSRRLTLLFLLLGLIAWSGAIVFGWFQSPRDWDLLLVFAAVGMTMFSVAVLMFRGEAQFLAVLGWGTYVALLLFMGSNHWNWELANSYPVKPVAAIVQQFTPDNQQIHTSDDYNRPSLNFYSDRQVLPAENAKLRRIWRRESQPYLLLDEATQKELNLRSAKVLGSAEGWQLITKSAQ
ncbi:ArnT family glycosyltransferase [Leptolyngbya ohadii]|uniref:ArnT family glycosyltransferase n=1 Tax=Leptolyngbya ohadii TaxID=1962290 RepID=UPI000B5992E4|nr:glycosyltransferase family 39 protein [Leptolyngbya ohadii]